MSLKEQITQALLEIGHPSTSKTIAFAVIKAGSKSHTGTIRSTISQMANVDELTHYPASRKFVSLYGLPGQKVVAVDRKREKPNWFF